MNQKNSSQASPLAISAADLSFLAASISGDPIILLSSVPLEVCSSRLITSESTLSFCTTEFVAINFRVFTVVRIASVVGGVVVGAVVVVVVWCVVGTVVGSVVGVVVGGGGVVVDLSWQFGSANQTV